MGKIFLIVFSAILSSCANGSGSTTDNSQSNSSSNDKELVKIESPRPNVSYIQGEVITVSYNANETLDSVVLYVDKQRQPASASNSWSYAVSEKHRVGKVPYRIEAFKGENKQIKVGEFAIKPKQKPIRYSYRITATYPHDKRAYTQGLYWNNGFLYEGTGQLGESSLRKVDLKTGKVLVQKNLPDEFFGEGIALLNGKIYQLTWQNNTGFVYDADTFEQVGRFGYGGEGWGIATDGKVLYMSDGSEKIYVVDPETFKRIREIEVYSDMGKIEYINELEWIDGEIWANVYTTDMIVRIDPETGSVLGMIDMGGLSKNIEKDATTDVFNGIAYDSATKSIYVTGKNWNKLFRIELIKK